MPISRARTVGDRDRRPGVVGTLECRRDLDRDPAGSSTVNRSTGARRGARPGHDGLGRALGTASRLPPGGGAVFVAARVIARGRSPIGGSGSAVRVGAGVTRSP